MRMSNAVMMAMLGGGKLCPEYKAVYNAMTVKPSTTDANRQNKLVNSLVKLGVWSKADLMNIYCLHGQEMINFLNPSANNPIKIGSPTFAQYAGFKSTANTNNINTNKIPATDYIHSSLNDMTIITGISDPNNTASDTAFEYGANDIQFISRNAANQVQSRVNCAYAGYAVNTKSTRHYASVRYSPTEMKIYVNKRWNIATPNQASTSLPANALRACSRFVTSASGYSTKTVMYLMVFPVLSDTEIRGIIDIMEAYLKSYGTNLITSEKNIAFDGHSFFGGTYYYTNYQICDQIDVTKWCNNAVSGSTLSQMIARSEALDAMPINKDTLVLWIGANDLGTAGFAASKYPDFKTYVQARLAAGFKNIIVYTTTPATLAVRPNPFESERNIWNNLLLTDLDLIAGVTVINTDLIPELTNPTNATYFYDGLHFTAAASVLAAAPAITLINSN